MRMGGRPRIDIAQFHRDPLRDDPLLATGIDEQQIFLSVVVEAENRLTGRQRRGVHRDDCRIHYGSVRFEEIPELLDKISPISSNRVP